MEHVFSTELCYNGRALRPARKLVFVGLGVCYTKGHEGDTERHQQKANH